MKAAEELFTSRRFHEITMDDVAAAAGVAKGTLYTNFKNKDDLFFETCISGFDELCELVSAEASVDVPFDQQLLATCRQISGFFNRRHQWMRMMQAEEGRMSHCKSDLRDRWTRRRSKLVDALGRIISRGIKNKNLRSDITPEVLANVLLGMLRAREHGLADAPSKMRRHEVIVELFCHGAAHRTRRIPRGQS